MSGETNLDVLLKSMKPIHHTGEYVFCTVPNSQHSIHPLHLNDIIMLFKEEEGTTIIIRKEVADQYSIPYTYISAWITLTIHSSLDAVGLTAAFSSALSKEGISCNVVAAYYHDHIFVPYHDVIKAMEVLNRFG